MTVMRQPGLNQLKAQGEAFKIARGYAFEHPKDIDLEALAVDLGLKVKFGGLSGCEARLVRSGVRGVIRVRRWEANHPRCRFGIAHELGHWRLHPDTQQFVCTSDNLRDYQKDPREREANAFASELLMPSGILRPFLERRSLSLETAVATAANFNVSITAAAIRLCFEKGGESYLVLSKDGRVAWASKFSERWGLWIERGRVLDEAAVAPHLTGGTDGQITIDSVPTSSWFPDYERDGVEVEEHSLSLGPSIVITLLLIGDAD